MPLRDPQVSMKIDGGIRVVSKTMFMPSMVRTRDHDLSMTHAQKDFSMTTMNTVDNGVNAQALLDARDALSASPAGAQFTCRATCKWIYGTHSRSTVKGFYG